MKGSFSEIWSLPKADGVLWLKETATLPARHRQAGKAQYTKLHQ